MTPPLITRQVSLEYRPAIDGLRALAVLSVFIFHLNHNWLRGGFVGVDVFFVISGYLITSIIYKECQKESFSLSKFYQRRIARIFPAFFTVALATLAGASFIYSPQDMASAGANLAAAALSVANLKFMMQGNYFEISPDAQPFLHYWSLSVEEQFYIFFPLLLLLLFKFARKHLALALGVLCVGSFVASVVVTYWKPVWAFYLLPTRAWELLAGCLLAVISDHAKPAPEARWPNPLSVFSLGLIIASFLLVHEGNHFPGYWALLPVVGAVGLLMPTRGGLLRNCWRWLPW
jgi:peptidoglycan/LPS O-acetylase OafA/YrhL